MSLVLLESSNGFYIVKDKKILKQHLFTNAKEALTDLEVLKSGTLPVSLSTLINDIKEEIVSSDNSLEMFKYDVEKYREAKNMHKSLYTETPTFLSHKMSESVVKVPVDLSTLIIKSFNIYDELDANLNLKIMKVRDWYGFCYPELSKIITDNRKYLECVVIIGNKNDLADVKLERIDGEVKKVKIDTNISSALFDEIVNSDCSKVEKLRKIGIEDGIIEDILESSQQSIGTEMTEEDLSKIVDVVRTILSDFEYKNNLMLYLKEKLNELMPNTKALIDNDLITCKLLAKAGSLTNLAKLPASTIQIYGAEKGYFNAVKAEGNTPKYGFIFHAPIVSRSVMKGKVARMLATKIILAVRVDFFGNKDGKYGEKLRIDLEKRVDRVENFKKKVKTVKKDKKVEFSDKKEYDTNKDK